MASKSSQTSRESVARNTVFRASQLPNYLGDAALRARRMWTGKNAERDKVLKTTGSPGFKPSRSQAKQVELMAATGLDAKVIGSILGIDKKLVEFFYSYELKTGAARALIPVAKAAYEMASDKRHPDMTKFVLQARGGPAWAPKSQIDHTGVDKDADDARTARAKLLEGDDVPTPAEGGETA